MYGLVRPNPGLGSCGSIGGVFKMEVFDALQIRFGPPKYTTLKTIFQNATLN